MDSSNTSRHIVRSVFIIVAALAYLMNILISRFSDPRRRPEALQPLFGSSNQSTGSVSRRFSTDVTPASWTFSIWMLIYAWQVIWILYSFTLICRRSVPAVLNWVFLLMFTSSSCVVTAWVVIWNRGMVQLASGFLFMHGFSLYGTLAVAFYRFDKLASATFPKLDFWAHQILVHNGLATYTTWVTIASLLSLNTALIYMHDVAKDTAGTITLSLLAAELVTWFILENTILERFLRYTLTIYPVVITALSGVVSRGPSPRNKIFAIVLLSSAVAIFVARLGLVTWRILKIRKTSSSADYQFHFNKMRDGDN